jgi:hypothetical protein
MKVTKMAKLILIIGYLGLGFAVKCPFSFLAWDYLIRLVIVRGNPLNLRGIGLISQW